MAKNAVFSPIFPKKIQNPAFNFYAFERKTQSFGKF